jgi:hypothetical protein
MDLRHEAMLMLDKRGALLETARVVSRIFREHHVPGAVIGGVAVVLHGHLRTTKDVDVLIQQPLESLKPLLESSGFTFNAANREFTHDGVPVHLVPQTLVKPQPTQFVEIEQITTLRLADLISIKLHSGSKKVARAQDLADVIGLIRQHKLTGAYASQVDPPMRSEFRKLVKAIAKD